MKRAICFLGIAALLLTAACGGKKTPDSSTLKAETTLSVLKDMGRAYEKKDLDLFMNYVSETYADREAFSNSVKQIFTKFETIRFNVQYAKMLIVVREKDTIKVTFNWDGEWVSSAGMTHKGGGRTTFVHDQGNSRLLRIEGKNPFVPTDSPVKQ